MDQNRTERAPVLGARLQKCADFIREGKTVADIGTDHGYVPVYLLQSGKVPFAVAADINEAPLESAKNNALRCGTADKMRFVLSDGLHEIAPDEADDILIAGMGGELILHIISEAPWLCAEEKHLVLQPMTTAVQLRRGLAALGFAVEREDAVLDSGKIYSVMSVYYTGEKRDELKLLELYMGKILPGSPFSARYAKSVRHNIENKIKGLKHSGEDSASLEILLEMITDMYGEEEDA